MRKCEHDMKQERVSKTEIGNQPVAPGPPRFHQMCSVEWEGHGLNIWEENAGKKEQECWRGRLTGDQFQGLQTVCLWANSSQETFCLVLLYLGLNGVKKKWGRGEESECFKKRCTVSSSGPTPSSCAIHGPTHPVVFLPGMASEFATPESPHFTDEEQGRSGLGGGGTGSRQRAGSECLSGQAFLALFLTPGSGQ